MTREESVKSDENSNLFAYCVLYPRDLNEGDQIILQAM